MSPKNLQSGEAARVFGQEIEHEYSLAELLRRPDVGYHALMSLNGGEFAAPELSAHGADLVGAGRGDPSPLSETVVEQVEIMARYWGYIERQKEEIERASHHENLMMPPDFDYLEVPALSIEARQILDRQRPQTLGLASRISGITPAAVSLLLVHLKKFRGKGAAMGVPEQRAGGK